MSGAQPRKLWKAGRAVGCDLVVDSGPFVRAQEGSLRGGGQEGTGQRTGGRQLGRLWSLTT